MFVGPSFNVLGKLEFSILPSPYTPIELLILCDRLSLKFCKTRVEEVGEPFPTLLVLEIVVLVIVVAIAAFVLGARMHHRKTSEP